jgi:glyoxylate/hydroxypyruvate reductase A
VIVLFQTSWASAGAWLPELRRQAPEIEFRLWPELGDPAQIEAALVWQPPMGLFDGMRRLRLIQVLGAGVDSLIASGIALPPGVPVTRVVDPVMSRRMAEYALYGVMRFHRRFDVYERQQRERRWDRHGHPDPAEVRVGIMGMGEIGATTARLMADLGYDLAGWSRSGRGPDGIRMFAGEQGLGAFLARTDVLLCLLPLTAATRGILDARLFARLPMGATVVNLARGGHLVEGDLLGALDGGQLGGAMLDVFEQEPLPASSPLWAHPKVLVTPHTAGITNPRTAGAGIVENLRRLARGEPLLHLVDPARGY